jgi:16S rRNA (guanine966-N2)-methyltransferase
MKITGGEFKGRTIKVPKNPNIRPSTEKTREAIFSALGGDVVDARVADLFCGSGALALEALSRGAAGALLIDAQPGTVAVARENIRALGLEARARVMNMNVFALRASHFKGINIVFADPPYKSGYGEKLLLSLQKFGWYGILVLEHDAKWRYDGDEYALVKRIDFGDTAVSFLLRIMDRPPDEKAIEKDVRDA